MKPDQERVRTLLTDTVTLLCKNGLQYSKELKVQGLLGITLDNDDVFVVHINEIFNGLLGAQVAVRAEESSVSAIAAADSATSDISLKSRKGIPHKYECPSPSGSSKRKARPPTMNPLAHVKQEHSEDEIVIMDTKSLDSAEFNADEIGEGDREAMRKSYGEMLEAPPAKRRVADSSGSFREKQSGGLLGGIIKDTKDKLGDSDNFDNLEGSSLDDSSSGLGPMTSDGQTAFDNSAGCSAWEGQEIGQGQSECGQDSVYAAWPGMDYMYMYNATQPSSQTSTGKLPMHYQSNKYHTAANKKGRKFQCTIEGCNRMFSYTFDVYRHQRAQHKICPSMYTKGRGASFEAYKVIENGAVVDAAVTINDPVARYGKGLDAGGSGSVAAAAASKVCTENPSPNMAGQGPSEKKAKRSDIFVWQDAAWDTFKVANEKPDTTSTHGTSEDIQVTDKDSDVLIWQGGTLVEAIKVPEEDLDKEENSKPSDVCDIFCGEGETIEAFEVFDEEPEVLGDS